MANDDQQIPEEYLDSNFDFGFTAADEDELNSLIKIDDAPLPMKSRRCRRN